MTDNPAIHNSFKFRNAMMFQHYVWFRACRTDRESEKITNSLFELQSFMMSKAKSIALASAEKIEEPSGRRNVLQASLE